MKKQYLVAGALLALSLFTACSADKSKQETSSSKVVVRTATSQTEKSSSELVSNDSLAEDFMLQYINQHFDSEELIAKADYLQSMAGDSSLDKAINDVVSIQSEVGDYLATKEIKNYASVTLVEREVKSITVYKNGAQYFVDVTYKESSPAYTGVFERRKQYTFKLEESKVVSFEEVLNR